MPSQMQSMLQRSTRSRPSVCQRYLSNWPPELKKISSVSTRRTLSIKASPIGRGCSEFIVYLVDALFFQLRYHRLRGRLRPIVCKLIPSLDNAIDSGMSSKVEALDEVPDDEESPLEDRSS